jgi:hypothetical protein
MAIEGECRAVPMPNPPADADAVGERYEYVEAIGDTSAIGSSTREKEEVEAEALGVGGPEVGEVSVATVLRVLDEVGDVEASFPLRYGN